MKPENFFTTDSMYHQLKHILIGVPEIARGWLTKFETIKLACPVKSLSLNRGRDPVMSCVPSMTSCHL